MGPMLGASFLSWVLPSPLLEDGLSTGPMALWIDNSEVAAVVEVVFIYSEYIWGNLHMNCREGNNTRKEGHERIRKDSVGRTL